MIDALEAQLAAWEDEGARAWFAEMCEQPGQCAGAEGEWYIDAECFTRCKRCDLKQ